MLKQLVFTIALFSFFSVFALAQEKPVQEKKEDHKHMEHMQKDSSESMMNHHQKTDSMKGQMSAQPWNKVCPVKGGEVDPEVETVEYNGKAYGFCCPGCDSKFKKDPEKYSKNLNEDGTKFIGKK